MDSSIVFTYADYLLLDKFAALINMRNTRPKCIGVRGHIVSEDESIIQVELFVEDAGSIVFHCLSGPEAGSRHEVSTIAELRAAQWPVGPS